MPQPSESDYDEMVEAVMSNDLDNVARFLLWLMREQGSDWAFEGDTRMQKLERIGAIKQVKMKGVKVKWTLTERGRAIVAAGRI